MIVVDDFFTAMNRTIATFVLFAFSAYAIGRDIPKGYTILDSSRSPDHRFGVTVPVFGQDYPESEPIEPKNCLVELGTGRVLTQIQVEVGYDRRLNFRETLPARWSHDGSLLVWTVAGKWFPTALVVLKMEKGQVLWQVDILKTAQHAILSRTKKVAPMQYAAAKKANTGNGSAYPEGFTIDVYALDPVAFPLRIHATLTSNPKEMDDFPNLDSHLDAVITSEGQFVVKDFQVEKERK